MRHALASLLLAILSFPLIAPVVLAKTASELPSCCRHSGKHRCAMADMNGARGMSTGPAARASQPKCPLFPEAQVVPAYSRTMLLTGAPRMGAPRFCAPTTARPDGHGPRTAFCDSVRKRGPPSNPYQTNRIS